MLSSVTPMVALTATVAAAVWLTYERNTAFDGGILADNLARHHGAVLVPRRLGPYSAAALAAHLACRGESASRLP